MKNHNADRQKLNIGEAKRPNTFISPSKINRLNVYPFPVFPSIFTISIYKNTQLVVLGSNVYEWGNLSDS